MSARYAKITLILLLVALVPTVVNSYFGVPEVDGPRLSEVVPETIDGHHSRPTRKTEGSIQRDFLASDWFERRYTLDSGDVKLLVVRSFDMKRLYHHPELAVASGTNYRAARVAEVPAAGHDIQVHVLEGETRGLVAYVLIYEGTTIAAPLWFQLKIAPELLLRGRRPLTLVMAQDESHRPGGPTPVGASTPAVTLVTAAVERLRQSR